MSQNSEISIKIQAGKITDIDAVFRTLGHDFTVTTTSRKMFDEAKKLYFQFASLSEKAGEKT